MSMIPVTKEVVDYIGRYGGRCRDCGDNNGVCPQSWLPCAHHDRAIRHVLEAYNYGVANGFLKSPALVGEEEIAALIREHSAFLTKGVNYNAAEYLAWPKRCARAIYALLQRGIDAGGSQ